MPKDSKFRYGKFSWFMNGIVLGVLLIAASNSVSYFIRSGSWQPLTDPTFVPQALGFPFEIWSLGKNYATGSIIDRKAMALNIVIAIAIGAGLGIWFAKKINRLNDFMEYMVEREIQPEDSRSWQFSVGGMLIFTGVAAVVFAIVRAAFGANPRLLIGVYVFGPAFLILMAMIPRGLSWKKRIVLLTPATILLIAFTMFVGTRIDLQFDHVMMGVFVCWVPQTVFAAVFLVLKLWVQHSILRSHMSETGTPLERP